MNETDFDSTASLDTKVSGMANAGEPQIYSFGYCGGCGSWDAHALECASCGYDFQSSPARSDQT